MRILQKKIRLCVIFVIVICIFLFVLVQCYHQNQIRKEYLSAGIYEIEGTFTYVMLDNSLFTYYMICEPPSESDELVKVVLQYIEEQSIVKQFQDRTPEYDADCIDLSFVKPSKSFPIGWNSGDSTGLLGTKKLIDYLLINVRIPKTAQSQHEYQIILVENGIPRIISS